MELFIGKYLFDGLLKEKPIMYFFFWWKTYHVLDTMVIAPQLDNHLKAAIGTKAIQAFLKPWSVRFCKVRLKTYKAFAWIVSQHHEDI